MALQFEVIGKLGGISDSQHVTTIGAVTLTVHVDYYPSGEGVNADVTQHVAVRAECGPIFSSYAARELYVAGIADRDDDLAEFHSDCEALAIRAYELFTTNLMQAVSQVSAEAHKALAHQARA
jgi:hypothetical protein